MFRQYRLLIDDAEVALIAPTEAKFWYPRILVAGFACTMTGLFICWQFGMGLASI